MLNSKNIFMIIWFHIASVYAFDWDVVLRTVLILHQNNVPLDCIHRWTLCTRDGDLQVCLRWKLNRNRNFQLLIISHNGIAMWLILLEVLFISTLDTRDTRPCYLLNKFCCMLTNHFKLESTIYHANFWLNNWNIHTFVDFVKNNPFEINAHLF